MGRPGRADGDILVSTRIRWIMLVSGLLTFTMIYAALAPQAAMQKTFGATLEGPLAVSLAADAVMVLLFIGCLVSLRRARTGS